MLAGVHPPVSITLAALVLSMTAACSKSAVPGAASTSASAASASTVPPPAPSSDAPAWIAFASRAPMYGEQAREARTGSGPKPPTLADIDALFDRMTKQPETAAGVRGAAKMLEEGRPLASDPRWAGSGSSPGATLLHHGGMALLVDLTQRACAANAGNKDIGSAADTVPLPPIFNSGGADRHAAERDRHVLQEAVRACGSNPGP